MGIQWCRYADSDKINIFYKTKVCCCFQHSLVNKFLQITVYNISDIIMTFIYKVYLFFLNIKSDCLKSSFCFLYSKWKSYISKTYYTNFDFFVFNFLQ